MPNLSDFNDPKKYNARLAQANADQQAAQHQAQTAVNQKTQQTIGQPGFRTAAPVAPNPLLQEAQVVYSRQPGQQTVGQNGQAVNINEGNIALNALNRLQDNGQSLQQAAGNINSDQYKAGVRGAFTGVGSSMIDTSGINSRLAAIDQKYAAQIASGMSIDPAKVAEEKAAAAQQFAAEEQARTEKQKQDTARAASSAASGAAAAENATNMKSGTSATQGNDPAQAPAPNPSQLIDQAGLEAILGTLTPEQRAYLEPALMAQMGALQAQQTANSQVYGADLNAAKSNYDTQDNFLNATKNAYDKLYKGIDELNAQTRDDQLANIADQEKVQRERLEWEQTKQTRDLKDAERKAIDQKIGEMAILGGFGSFATGQVVDETRNKFESAISDLATEYSMQKSENAVKFTALHNQVLSEYRASSINSMTSFVAKLEQLGGQFASNTQARTNAEAKAFKDFTTAQQKVQTDAADKLTGFTNDVYKLINEKRDDERTQEKLGWDRLEWAVKTYGSYTPPEILASIGKQLPGVDVSRLAQSMTLAEMKQFKIKNGGGSGSGGGLGSYDAAQTSAAAQVFSGMTKDQLRGAVERIFTPTNYGGTAGERIQKQNQYFSRIASGEDPAVIAASLQNDYWASQKGAPRTAHDGRVEAQASSESLQSYVDYYGIGENDDGPLGFFDSKVEGMKSIFGLSSEEYNNLANNVGNIRARIIKENYGAAVTPQELQIAKSYIPDMSDKGAMFITKLKNLQSYQAYLDAKVFANATGLPAPKPPMPVTLSGNAMAGPGKYSDADITSALAQ